LHYFAIPDASAIELWSRQENRVGLVLHSRALQVEQRDKDCFMTRNPCRHLKSATPDKGKAIKSACF